jgi:hypothetical protein
MAKQTFTTGQVLTAAQMTSLQQTAMGGGSATTKTASYVLVAADAGTTVTMTSASATTITVNTSLFAAGDTVYIQNLGAGVSTITAGTATVNTSASLALAQYEGGQLYFNSTSAAIFVKGAGAAASSGGMTQLATGSLSGASVSLTSIAGTYKDLQLVVRDWLPATANQGIALRYNGDTGANTHNVYLNTYGEAQTVSRTFAQFGGTGASTTASNGLFVARIPDYANSVTYKFQNGQGFNMDSTTATSIGYNNWIGVYTGSTNAITQLDLLCTSGNFISGTYILYGVQ